MSPESPPAAIVAPDPAETTKSTPPGVIALFGALALVLAFFSLVALTVGLVIALTPLLTAFGATAAVFGGLLLLGAVCAWLAATRWRRMVAALSNRAPD